ncbi:MAG TPA: hypothetical protein VNK41_07055 [Vicinamibacterales bacterium]|nr:hypothetical protein [Vicinamibacterales bacterium]
MMVAGPIRGWRELTLVVFGFSALTVLMLSPLALNLGSVARLDNADAQFLIWNVAWVARTAIVDPLHVFDANIFHPRRWTLAYSESNLGAGILAIPVYWATRNPYAAHNFVTLLSFVLSGTAMYYLVRRVANDRRAAVISGIAFAFTPYVFSHLPHIHLLMTAGLPLGMLAFHRVVEHPGIGRGAALGAAMAGQAVFCGYYAIFLGLMVGFAVLVAMAVERRWTDRRLWTALAVAALVAAALAMPLFVPYMQLQRETGFARPLDDARMFAADWRAYLASSAYAHRWLLPIIGSWREVLFPGFLAVLTGIAGVIAGWRSGGRVRGTVLLYASLAAVALWASFGPDAGLYAVFYGRLPAFSLMRAASRFGLIATLALCVLGGIALAALFARLDKAGRKRARAAAAAIAALAILELLTPLSFTPVPPIEMAYRVLATLPRGPVIEMPFYSNRYAAERVRYILNSTAHWMPLVNGYSSYTPRDFLDKVPVLGGFPSRESFAVLKPDGVRYAVFHMDRFAPEAREDLLKRLEAFEPYLVRHYADDRIWLYEIVEYPDE